MSDGILDPLLKCLVAEPGVGQFQPLPAVGAQAGLFPPLLADGFLFQISAFGVVPILGDAVAGFSGSRVAFADGWASEPDSAGTHIEEVYRRQGLTPRPIRG